MKYLLTLALASLISFQTLADDLTSKDISQWLKAMPKLQPWLEKNESKLSAHISDPNNPEIIFSESISALKKAGLYDELNNKIQALGYDNPEQWTDVSQRVTYSWLALELEANKAQIDAAKAQYDAMMKNPDIPDAQKQMMTQMMSSGFAMTKLVDKASAADIKTIKAHQGALRTYFEQSAH